MAALLPFPCTRALAIALTLFALPIAAEVERLEIKLRQPVAEGAKFGDTGSYEKLAGRLHFALDPAHPRNQAIVDLDKAPRGRDGKVRFWADVYLLRPVDAKKGNGAVLLEVPNRGSKAAPHYFQRGAERSLDPVRRQDHGDALLLRQGFTLAWVGWQDDVPSKKGNLRREHIRAKATPAIEGLARADHVFSKDAVIMPLGHRGHRAYPAADPKNPRNLLTERDGRLAPRRVIPRESWRFARVANGEIVPDPRFLHLDGGFKKGKIYEIVYVAREPAVVGLGLAALRDAAAFFKHSADSPVRAERVLGLGISQTGRFLRHFLYQGFQVDEAGGPAFDGLLVHAAGAGRGSFNHRFAQPSRDAHPYSAFFYPTDLFPFSTVAQEDSLSGLKDSLFARLPKASRPKIFFTNTGYEYWGRAAALIHTTADGEKDLEPSPEVRIYHFAGSQHFVEGFPPPSPGTRHPANPADFRFSLRALLLDLDAWVARGTAPPPSRYPRIADGTLVPAEKLTFPHLPGIEVPRRAHQAYRADYGPHFRSLGIIARQPPGLNAPFPTLVPQVDSDGNARGGLRLPQIAVPVATYTPWNFRAEKFGAPTELADFRGSFLPFPKNAAEGEQRGDPRKSLMQRYPSRKVYLERFEKAAQELIAQRYLLAEDLPELRRQASRLWDAVSQGSIRMPRAQRRRAASGN